MTTGIIINFMRYKDIVFEVGTKVHIIGFKNDMVQCYIIGKPNLGLFMIAKNNIKVHHDKE